MEEDVSFWHILTIIVLRTRRSSLASNAQLRLNLHCFLFFNYSYSYLAFRIPLVFNLLKFRK